MLLFFYGGSNKVIYLGRNWTVCAVIIGVTKIPKAFLEEMNR